MVNMIFILFAFSELFKGTVNFTIKEAYTGKKISCHVDVYGGKKRILTENIDGSWKVLLKTGDYRFIFSKHGYFSISTHFTVKRDTVLNITVYLSPQRREDIFPPRVNGIWIIRGYVTDRKGNPLEGIKVSISGNNIGTVTDKKGVFELSLPKEHIPVGHSFIPKDTIVLVGGGYKIYYKEIFHLEENVVLRISMEKGMGSVFKGKIKSPGTGNSEVPQGLKKNE